MHLGICTIKQKYDRIVSVQLIFQLFGRLLFSCLKIYNNKKINFSNKYSNKKMLTCSRNPPHPFRNLKMNAMHAHTSRRWAKSGEKKWTVRPHRNYKPMCTINLHRRRLQKHDNQSRFGNLVNQALYSPQSKCQMERLLAACNFRRTCHQLSCR